MAPKSKIIIDTDPGVDDILGILLALSAKRDELEVLLLSLTFGNIDVHSCLRNVVTMFYCIEKELQWREAHGKPRGFEAMLAHTPLVAIGAEAPLEDQKVLADYYHGVDGLAGIHTTHSHFTPDETWKALFDPSLTNQETGKLDYAHELSVAKALFRPSHKPAHQEILSLLRQNEPDTITIVAIGPLTNLALAAAEDPETFLRAKEVVVMGGAIGIEGNVTPVAEFNTFADAIAAARVFALTSPSPNSTVPPMRSVSIDGDSSSSSDVYPKPLSKQLNLTLLPLDITNSHLVGAKTLAAVSSSLVKAGSPLATFVHAFLGNTFAKISEIEESPEGMSLHDPLCIWYVITRGEIGWKFAEGGKEDIRVETMGQWTRGQCILDRRTRKKATSEEEEVVGDHGSWLSLKKGNRLNRIVETGVRETFGAAMLTRIFGPTAA